MAAEKFMDRLRSFLGLRIEPPKNEFRNPIWGSDDDDDGDELYTRSQIEAHPPVDLHRELAKHMHDIFSSFGGVFGDMRSFFNDDSLDIFAGASEPPVPAPDTNSNSIRDYYLKPSFHNQRSDEPKDIDLDGKISSQEISGLLKRKEEGSQTKTIMPFDGMLVQGRSCCQTVITTSVTKADGTVETRRIVKNGNEIVEDITTSSPDSRGPQNLDKLKR